MALTRTLGPLHFEDLEPKRFEDLARQLIYDYKQWRRLEATGRSGSDDGFDARGYEMRNREVLEASPVSALTDEDGSTVDGEEALVEGHDDRLWLVQCKREKAIGPTKLVDYLDEIVLFSGEKLHGIVFTAACDFSKKARDQFAEKCREIGVEEWHLWGKAELEDRLFRPENDHLLFAYFGVSLTIRKRSQRIDLRAKLTMKRKANRLLGSHKHTHLLLRPPEAPTYPDSREVRDSETGDPPWLVRQYRHLSHEGLLFCVRRYFAYFHDDGKHWDAAMAFDDVRSSKNEDCWRREEEDFELRSKVYKAWDELPKANRAWLEVLGVIPFENILDIDDIGDEYFSSPHVYASFMDRQRGPFKSFYLKLETTENYDPRVVFLSDKDKDRISIFPEEIRLKTHRILV